MARIISRESAADVKFHSWVIALDRGEIAALAVR